MSLEKLLFTGFHKLDQPNAILSNWYPATFTYNHVTFNCAEQFMMFHKLMVLGCPYEANQILKMDDPDSMKKLARNTEAQTSFELWKKIRYEVVKRGNYARFLQNPDQLEFLLSTGHNTLVECASGDDTWGIDLELGDPRTLDITQWGGSSYLGRILMEIRESLRPIVRIQGSTTLTFPEHSALFETLWKQNTGIISRNPAFYDAIQAYTDTFSYRMIHTFYSMTFQEVEERIRSNSEATFPVVGFFEMKEELRILCQIQEI